MEGALVVIGIFVGYIILAVIYEYFKGLYYKIPSVAAAEKVRIAILLKERDAEIASNKAAKKVAQDKINAIINARLEKIRDVVGDSIEIKPGGQTMLTYVKVFNANWKPFYKIGFTTRHSSAYSSSSKFGRTRYKEEEIFAEYIQDAPQVKAAIKKLFKSEISNKKLVGTKGTDIFAYDVLGLDT